MILILDDDLEFMTVVKDTLKKLGIEVLGSTDPIEAIGICRTKNVTKVITDFDMPAMDGIEFLENIKEINPNIKRIILTGIVGDEKNLNKAKIENLIDVIAYKPIDRKGLIDLLA